MKGWIIRLLTLVLGIWTGIMSFVVLKIQAPHSGFYWFFIFQALCILIAFIFEETVFKSDTCKVIGIIFGFIISYPAAWVIVYCSVAVKTFLRFILRFTIFRVIGALLLIILMFIIVSVIVKLFTLGGKDNKK